MKRPLLFRHRDMLPQQGKTFFPFFFLSRNDFQTEGRGEFDRSFAFACNGKIIKSFLPLEQPGISLFLGLEEEGIWFPLAVASFMG